MSWYRTGTVTVATGSKNVTGVGTLWASSVNVGDAFALVDANGNPTGAWYEVETVTSNTALVLKQTYTGTPAPGSNKQYAVFNLVGNMTTPSFAQRLAQFFDQFQDLVDLPTTTPTASSIPIAGSGGTLAAGWLPAATTSAAGAVELATAAEATAGNDTTRAITPSVSGSRTTFATTSTDDATSATAAPLKSAGGLAVAKSAMVGESLLVAGRILGPILGYKLQTPVDAGTQTITLAMMSYLIARVRVDIFGGYYTINRNGYASYEVFCHVHPTSVLVNTIQAPTNVPQYDASTPEFTTGFSFSAVKTANNTLVLSITKPSGAAYSVLVTGGSFGATASELATITSNWTSA